MNAAPPEVLTGAASTTAPTVDGVFIAVMVIVGLVTLGVLATMVAFVVRYRYRPGVNEHGADVPDSNRLEIGWTLVTTVLFVAIFVLGAVGFDETQRPPPAADAVDVFVTGKQWMWKVQHPSGRREVATLHVPAGRVVRVWLASDDVIHSFYVPAFRVKQDAVPGRTTLAWFQATTPGRYRLSCAEYCGTNHARMNGWVVVLPPHAWEAWLESRAPDESPLEAAGRAAFAKYDCGSCHQTRERHRAPPLEGLYGARRVFFDGREAVADDAYLRESVVDPAAKVIAGYDAAMPSYAGVISEQELAALVYYLRTLGDATGVHR